MKKILMVFASILIGIFVLLSLLDKSPYPVEKKLWRVQKNFDEIARDPSVVPQENFEQVASGYRKIIKQYPQSPLVPRIYLQTGKLYMLKKDYAKARENFGEVLKQFPDKPAVCAEAAFHIGLSHETEGHQQKAISQYRQIMAEYPLSDAGLNMYLYLANYYLRLNKLNESNAVLREATSFYQKVGEEKAGSPEGFTAMHLLITTYYAQKDWRKAVDTLGRLLLDYAAPPYLTAPRAATWIRSINTISAAQLQDYETPLKIYSQFIEKNPGHPLNKTLEDMIKALKELKEKNVVVSTQKPQ